MKLKKITFHGKISPPFKEKNGLILVQGKKEKSTSFCSSLSFRENMYMFLKEKQSFAGNLEMLRKKLDTNWIHELRFLAGVFQEFLGHVYIFCGQGIL